MCLVVTHYHLSQRVITGDIATHGKLCVQAEGYSTPTAHHHLPIPRTLGLSVISISERWRHAHFLSRPSLPTNLCKETQTSMGKDVSKDLLAKERKGREDGKWKRKRRKREGKRECRHLSIKWGINWFTNGIKRRNAWVIKITKYKKQNVLPQTLATLYSLSLSSSKLSGSPTEIFFTFFSLMLAPFRTRISTTSPFPFWAAMCNGVLNQKHQKYISTPSCQCERPSVIKYITLSIIHPSNWKSSSSPNPCSSCHSHIQWSVPSEITNQPNE